jgi:hypothetical protein
MRRKNRRELTLVAACSAILIATSMGALARLSVRMQRAQELRRAERKIRAAIGKYRAGQPMSTSAPLPIADIR